MDDKIAVVITTYNRPKSLLRVLSSLSNAFYGENELDLIISIDRCKDENIHKQLVNAAEGYVWEYGNKILNIETENLGLKNHILKCGNYTKKYDYVIILEDDVFVSENFYSFTKEAINFYKGDDRIAGISLYNHQINVCGNRPFIPIDDDSDVYFLQYAQSWGQVWSKSMWMDFTDWLKQQGDTFESNSNIPKNVSQWPKTSWLKYHIKYVIEKDLYFVYPKVSLTTNFTDTGTHNKVVSSDYQVPIQFKKRNSYKFANLDESLAVYDAFFENTVLSKYFLNIDELCIDLYGNKVELGKFVLTTKELKNSKLIKSFGLKLRPHEANVLLDVPGDDIYLYEIENTLNIEQINKKELLSRYAQYDLKGLNKKLTIVGAKHIIQTYLNKMLKKG